MAKKAPPPSPKALYEPIGNHHPSTANEVIVTHLASKQLAFFPPPTSWQFADGVPVKGEHYVLTASPPKTNKETQYRK